MRGESPTELGVSARGARVTRSLVEAAAYFGFRAQTEYPVPGGRVDVVWHWHSAIPGVEGDLPIVAFEIESSWRTRKHIKGDFVNLQDACPLIGIIVLLGEGDDVESTRRFASQLVDRPGSRIVVWSEKDVEALIAVTKPPEVGVAALLGPDHCDHRDESMAFKAAGDDSDAPTPSGVEHGGKYRPLWKWLRRQASSPVAATFADVEHVLGFPLPLSCRRRLPHWYGYANTAVGRAIRDAGWRARRVDLNQETVIFERAGREE